MQERISFAHHHWAFTTIERCYKLLVLQTSIWVLARAKESNLPNCIRKQCRVATRQQRSMVALGPFTQEVVGASIRTSRDIAACGVG